MRKTIGRWYVVGFPLRAEVSGLAGKQLGLLQPGKEEGETLPGFLNEFSWRCHLVSNVDGGARGSAIGRASPLMWCTSRSIKIKFPKITVSEYSTQLSFRRVPTRIGQEGDVRRKESAEIGMFPRRPTTTTLSYKS